LGPRHNDDVKNPKASAHTSLGLGQFRQSIGIPGIHKIKHAYEFQPSPTFQVVSGLGKVYNSPLMTRIHTSSVGCMVQPKHLVSFSYHVN